MRKFNNRIISNTFQLGLMVLIALAFVSCDAKIFESKWVANPITVDGIASDWRGIALHKIADSDASFGISNNEDNIYLILRFQDSQWARAMRQNGLTIWIDDGRDESKDLGIKFQDGPDMAEIMLMEGRSTNEMRPEMVERMQQMESQLKKSLTFIDKANLIKSEIEPDGSNGPKAAFAIDKSFVVYEFSLPIGKSEVRDYGLDLEPGQEFGIILEFGGHNVRTSNDRSERGGVEMSGGGKQGGSRMGGGGGRRGGMGGRKGGDTRQRQQQLEKQELKVNTALALSDEPAK